MGVRSNQKKISDFSTRGCVLYNAHGRAIGPRLGLSGGSWPILRPWQDRSQHRFLQNQVPKKQLVWTCRAGPSTSRGLVNTWWSQTWHSLFHTHARHVMVYMPRHGLHEQTYMDKCMFVYSKFARFAQNLHSVCTFSNRGISTEKKPVDM